MSRFRANRAKSSSFSLLFSISRVALEVSPSLVEATTRRGCTEPGETKTNRRQTFPRAIRTGPARKARVPRPTRARIAEEANRRRSLRFSRRSKADERMQARENAQHSRGTKARKPGIFGPDFSERCPPSWSRLTTGVDQRIISRSRFFRVSLSSYLSTYLPISASPSRSRSLPPCLFFACSLCPLGSQFALSLLSLSVTRLTLSSHAVITIVFFHIYIIYI